MAQYGQFCPVAKSTEVLGAPWTMLIIRELCCGEQSFNNLRMGLPLISPSLLSTRLKMLERQQVIARNRTEHGVIYSLTEAGEELRPVITALGIWGQRWVRSDMSKKDLDPTLLMWDIHRRIDLSYFPPTRTVIHFQFTDFELARRFWWLLVEDGNVDICLKDPGYDPDLCIKTELKTLAQVWMGDLAVAEALAGEQIRLMGSTKLKQSFKSWIGKNTFADYPSAV